MTIRFQDTIFWKNYQSYDRVLHDSFMRSTVDSIMYWKLLCNFNFNKFLEIGVYQGLTTGLFVELSPTATVTGIDPINRLDNFYKFYEEYADRFTFINQRSQDVTINDTFDFILIDGDHSYDSVNYDINRYLPLLNKNGILAIDDYKLPEVQKAIQNLHNKKSGWVPFLRTEQTEFWHHSSADRGDFIDGLFTDLISKFIFIRNECDQFNNIVCVATTISMITDYPDFFDLALKHYNI